MAVLRRMHRAAVTLLRKLRSFFSFEASSRRRVLIAMGILGAISIALRPLGLQRLQRRLSQLLPASDAGSIPVPPSTVSRSTVVENWAWAVRVAARNVPCRARCLEQSLTLWFLLRRRCIAAELRIGVRKSATQQLEAHAWVEIDDIPINDRADIAQRYAAFEGPLPRPVEVR